MAGGSGARYVARVGTYTCRRPLTLSHMVYMRLDASLLVVLDEVESATEACILGCVCARASAACPAVIGRCPDTPLRNRASSLSISALSALSLALSLSMFSILVLVEFSSVSACLALAFALFTST